MGRLACLAVRSASGEFLDPTTGRVLGCIAEGADVQKLVEVYQALRNSQVVRRGNSEVRISEIRMLANHTAGGEMKAPVKVRA